MVYQGRMEPMVWCTKASLKGQRDSEKGQDWIRAGAMGQWVKVLPVLKTQVRSLCPVSREENTLCCQY